MPNGPTPRLLETLLTCTDDRLLGVLPRLRDALSGQGPALALSSAVSQSDHRPTAGVPRQASTGPAEARSDPRPPGSPDRPDGPEPAVLGPAEPPLALTGPDDDPTDPTAISVRTSGSTGRPKRVLLSASALLASAAATHDRLGGSGHWLLALPAEHVAGLQVLVRTLVAGTTPVVMDLGRGFTAAGFADATERLTGARRYTSLVPTQVTRILDSGDTRAIEALCRYDAILVGGAAAGPTLLERAAAVGARLVTTYGSSETAGGCVYDGVPLDGVEIDLEPDTGRIRIGGPTLARGYLGDPAAGAAAFDGRPRRFVTNDHGFWADGRLTVLGRLDSIIVTGGVKVAPGPVEAALHLLPGVAEAVVVGVADPEWGQRVAAALVLAPGAARPTLAQARALVTEQVSARSAPRQVTVLDHLPLRGPGKPDRTAITTMLTSTSSGSTTERLGGN